MKTQTLHFSETTTIALEQICSDLSHRTLRVWLLIKTIGEQNAKDVWIKQTILAEKLRVSVDTIRRAIRELVEKKLLVLKKERFERRFKSYERIGAPAETPAKAGHPGIHYRDPSHDKPSGLDSGNESRNDHNTNVNGLEFPTDPLEQVAYLQIQYNKMFEEKKPGFLERAFKIQRQIIALARKQTYSGSNPFT